MPFYFRIPLPGPLGYSKRIGGKRQKAVPQPVRTLTRAERQEQRERDIRRARTFIVSPANVVHGEDGSLSFLAEFGMDESGSSRTPVQVTIKAGENDRVRWAIEAGDYLAVTFNPDMRTVESVDGT
jgi:hypothetical protein